MYKIKLTCFDPPYDQKSYADTVEGDYAYEKDAKSMVMQCVIEETATLNEPDIKFRPRTNIFVPMLNYPYNGINYDAAIVMWDGKAGIKEQPVTLYKIEWENNSSVDKFNKMLKDTYGESLTLWVRSEMDENDDGDEVEQFYYEGATCGRSDHFDSAEEAYNEACDYMDNIDLYVDY